jgi:hypothetical protein
VTLAKSMTRVSCFLDKKKDKKMNVKIYKKVCEYCGEKFETTVYWAKYCSESHRQCDYAKRKREQEKQEQREQQK